MTESFIWYNNFSSRLFRFVTKHGIDRQTDGQTDRRTERKAADSAVLLNKSGGPGPRAPSLRGPKQSMRYFLSREIISVTNYLHWLNK